MAIAHLPGETFIEYQLHAQQARPDAFVAVAGYGDLGTGYITLERSFAEGGYEQVAETLFNEVAVDGFFLEYDDQRSGDFTPLLNGISGDKIDALLG